MVNLVNITKSLMSQVNSHMRDREDDFRFMDLPAGKLFNICSRKSHD
jgi:hypothetical protein